MVVVGVGRNLSGRGRLLRHWLIFVGVEIEINVYCVGVCSWSRHDRRWESRDLEVRGRCSRSYGSRWRVEKAANRIVERSGVWRIEYWIEGFQCGG